MCTEVVIWPFIIVAEVKLCEFLCKPGHYMHVCLYQLISYLSFYRSVLVDFPCMETL